MSPDGPNEGDEEKGATFHRRLGALKEQGSAVLVVGRVPWTVWVSACEQLLGEGDTLPRQRLIAFTNGRRSVESRLRAHHTGSLGTTRALTVGETRGTAVETTTDLPSIDDPSTHGLPADDADVPVTQVDGGSLSELGATISAWVRETAARHGPLSPGELRLGIDSLSPLLDDHGEQAVREFVALTAARVRAVDGMAHYHLSVDPDSEVVRSLRPVADALIQLRISHEGPQQRWLLDDGTARSPWITL